MPERFRTKQVTVHAIQWVGGDHKPLDDFCGRNWTRADVVDLEPFDKEQVVVWNAKLQDWLKLPIGW